MGKERTIYRRVMCAAKTKLRHELQNENSRAVRILREQTFKCEQRPTLFVDGCEPVDLCAKWVNPQLFGG